MEDQMGVDVLACNDQVCPKLSSSDQLVVKALVAGFKTSCSKEQKQILEIFMSELKRKFSDD